MRDVPRSSQRQRTGDIYFGPHDIRFGLGYVRLQPGASCDTLHHSPSKDRLAGSSDSPPGIPTLPSRE